MKLSALEGREESRVGRRGSQIRWTEREVREMGSMRKIQYAGSELYGPHARPREKSPETEGGPSSAALGINALANGKLS